MTDYEKDVLRKSKKKTVKLRYPDPILSIILKLATLKVYQYLSIMNWIHTFSKAGSSRDEEWFESGINKHRNTTTRFEIWYWYINRKMLICLVVWSRLIYLSSLTMKMTGSWCLTRAHDYTSLPCSLHVWGALSIFYYSLTHCLMPDAPY